MTTRSGNPGSGVSAASTGTGNLPSTWEHPISWDSLEKYFKPALNKDTRKVFNMLQENSKSLEDHLDTAYLKSSGGAVAGAATFTGSVTLPGTISLGGTLISTLNFPPVGSIMPYAGSASPPGWLLCDGSQYSTSTYASLFAVCGTTYNTSAGQSAPSSGNFRVPTLKGRMPVGLDSGITDFNALGKSGGSTTVTITVAQLPSHRHENTVGVAVAIDAVGNHQHSGTTASNGSHAHVLDATYTAFTGAHDLLADYVATGTAGAPTLGSGLSNAVRAAGSHDHTFDTSNSGAHGHTNTATVTVTNAYTGSGNAVDNMSPYLILNYIIKT